MPDTGSPWNIPYVAASDLVKDWPTANQTLAEAVADGLDVAAVPVATTVTKTDTFSLAAGTSFTNITDLEVAVTSTLTSKYLVVADVALGFFNPGATTTALRLTRNGSAIYVGDAAGSRTQSSSGNDGAFGRYAVLRIPLITVDTPGVAGTVTYRVQMQTPASYIGYVNRTEEDADLARSVRVASSLTVIEVR